MLTEIIILEILIIMLKCIFVFSHTLSQKTDIYSVLFAANKRVQSIKDVDIEEKGPTKNAE